MTFTVLRRNGTRHADLNVTLNLPGEHNVLNALAAIAVATELELPDAPWSKRWLSSPAWAGVFQRYEITATCGRRRSFHPD